MIHLVRLSEGKELPRFQHFRSSKASNKFLNARGKIISAETFLDEKMFVDEPLSTFQFCHFCDKESYLSWLTFINVAFPYKVKGYIYKS